MAVLVWDSPHGRVVFELDRRLLVVGRDEANDIRLDDASVSRRHALLEQGPDGVRLTDLGSTTGTKINGARLTPDLPSTLQPGDFVSFGRVVATFHHLPPPPAAPPPRRARRGGRSIAAAIGVLAVVCAGAVFALMRPPPRDAPAPPPPAPPKEPARAEPVPAAPEPPPPVPKAVEPEEPAPPEPPPGPPRAKPNELPPSVPAPLQIYPDLVETSDAFYPFRTTLLASDRVEGLGSDGRIYALARAKVERVLDRVELARRAALRRGQLDAGDVAGRMDLARWCIRRHCLEEARTALREVLARHPGEPTAKALLDAIKGE